MFITTRKLKPADLSPHLPLHNYPAQSRQLPTFPPTTKYSLDRKARKRFSSLNSSTVITTSADGKSIVNCIVAVTDTISFLLFNFVHLHYFKGISLHNQLHHHSSRMLFSQAVCMKFQKLLIYLLHTQLLSYTTQP